MYTEITDAAWVVETKGGKKAAEAAYAVESAWAAETTEVAKAVEAAEATEFVETGDAVAGRITEKLEEPRGCFIKAGKV